MANHNSTKKRIRSTKVRQEGNKYLHKTVRNAMRSVLDSSKENDKKTPKIVSMTDKLEKRNVTHKNKIYTKQVLRLPGRDSRSDSLARSKKNKNFRKKYFGY